MKTIQTPEYRRCYAIAKVIPHRENKKAIILHWCACAKAMIGVKNGR